jgi:GNAT superfamily N-acetyltransferase
MPIRLAESEADIARCFPVMVQLRPELCPDDFVRRVRRQQAQGYRLAMLEHEDRLVCVGGYRFVECLAWGRAMYVDDLVTDAHTRSSGHGRQLLHWLITEAKRNGCEQFHLDSGVQRFAAHRFYLSNRMDIVGHHFRLTL